MILPSAQRLSWSPSHGETDQRRSSAGCRIRWPGSRFRRRLKASFSTGSPSRTRDTAYQGGSLAVESLGHHGVSGQPVARAAMPPPSDQALHRAATFEYMAGALLGDGVLDQLRGGLEGCPRPLEGSCRSLAHSFCAEEGVNRRATHAGVRGDGRFVPAPPLGQRRCRSGCQRRAIGAPTNPMARAAMPAE